MSAYDVERFEDFWPFYVRMHAQPRTQRLHAVATLTAMSCGIAALVLRQPLFIPVGLGLDHLIAQLAHRRYERNRTKPWRHLAWHARAEVRMFALVMSGRMQVETSRCQEATR